MNLFVVLISLVAVANADLPKIAAESKDGQFYRIDDANRMMNWMTAQQQCQARGDHLASIHSASEQNAVANLCKANKKDSKGEIFQKYFFLKDFFSRFTVNVLKGGGSDSNRRIAGKCKLKIESKS